jgi:hypothetical protein
MEGLISHHYVPPSFQSAPRESLELVAEKDAIVVKNLLSMTTRNLQHAEDHMLLLARDGQAANCRRDHRACPV